MSLFPLSLQFKIHGQATKDVKAAAHTGNKQILAFGYLIEYRQIEFHVILWSRGGSRLEVWLELNLCQRIVLPSLVNILGFKLLHQDIDL